VDTIKVCSGIHEMQVRPDTWFWRVWLPYQGVIPVGGASYHTLGDTISNFLWVELHKATQPRTCLVLFPDSQSSLPTTINMELKILRVWECQRLHNSRFLISYRYCKNKSDISYLKTSWAFDVLIHSGKPNAVG